ncbi:MAG: TrbC/VirB2 family protein [Hyphomonadaceae bacterium]|nr:TrbC/VirB2 family protein [Hyphomonadaceae bacterium]
MKNTRLIMLTGVTLAALAMAAPAYASGSGMPWEGPLQQVLDSITGPVARAVGVIAIVMAGFTIAFSDGGSGVRKLAWAGLGLACVFAAATWGLTLFGFAGGAVL